MFDIDALVFGTKKKSKPMPKLKTDGFKSFNLLGGSSRHFIIGDKITPKQRVAIRKDPFSDYDKDGVINGLDCQPRNRKKHMGRYLSTRFRGVGYSKDPQLSHLDIDPYSYNSEQVFDNLKNQPVRFSTKKEAIRDSYSDEIQKMRPAPNIVSVHAGESDEWEENMEHTPYRERFMRGLSVLQKVDKLNDDIPVRSSFGDELGSIGSIKQYYGKYDETKAYETKYFPTDKLVEMRAKHGHNTIPMTPKREPYTMDKIRNNTTSFGPEPIRVTPQEMKKEIIQEGKHRLIIAKELDKNIYPVQVEKNLKEDKDV